MTVDQSTLLRVSILTEAKEAFVKTIQKELITMTNTLMYDLLQEMMLNYLQMKMTVNPAKLC